MCSVLNKVNDAGERAGLQLNAKKTKVMPINCQTEVDPIRINGIDLDYVSYMKYLGSIKESDGSCTKDVTVKPEVETTSMNRPPPLEDHYRAQLTFFSI